MKKILPLITLLIGLFNTSNAQTDYCKDITKDATDARVIYMSPTPGDKKEDVGVLSLAKVINDEGTHYYLRLGLCMDDPNKTITDASMTFEDGDVIKFSNLSFKVGQKNAINEYVYSAAISLTDEEFAKLKIKKFKLYSVGDKKVYGGLGNPKGKLMAYANCLDTFTQGPVPVVNANEKKSIDGFWGIKFGASMDEAKAAVIAKGGKLITETSKADELHFENVVFTERKVDALGLRFVNGKFYQALVLFPTLDEGVVISKFNTIVSELNNVYGPAVITKKFQPPYDTGTGEYDVQAITFGKGLYYAFWTTNNKNNISLEIAKDLHFNLFYTDTTLAKEKTAQKSSDY
ncbi:hypothetical protein KXQ82_09045 [Mucilaginibacter sp. HMF5004]|uniref:hypothetical protein n=1 Tax=Mucilaginibacter rivuli TaxID=2857527 RepID=UPI001C5F9212|nr:hypothetical protein [Mucilaginibacter rivuli]MBW4889861.1 hypothetical protein [Mucilaginibacter rivuli]